MKPVDIVIIDDHWVVREGIKSVLKGDPAFQVVGEASNGNDGLNLLRDKRPDIALVDIRLPDISGAEVCQRATAENLPTAIIILTAFLDWRLVQTCLQWGARGYLLKDAGQHNLKQNLLAVVRGETILNPKALSLLVNYIREHPGLNHSEPLSPQEMEILRLMSHGLSNTEIGERVYLSQGRVKDYVHNILHKLHARNRVEAILIATKSGLL